MNEYGDGVAWTRGSMIGKGSHGRVYQATRASKYSCFPPVMAVKSAEVSLSSSIQKEKEILTNLRGCPNIIRCYGEETTRGPNGGLMAYNLLLEYASGGTLGDRIKQSGSCGLPELEAKVYARSILRGLRHIHVTGYVHCDLKPDNILLAEKINGGGFRAKIGDFGVAKRVGKLQRSKLLQGTRMYLSPEAVMDRVQEMPSDVWAFGCVVLEMLTGKAPLDGVGVLGAESILRRIGEGRGLVNIPDGVSVEAKDFLNGCFVANPVFRWDVEKLLCHDFVQGLDIDDEGDEEEEAAVTDFGAFVLVRETSGDECDSSSSGLSCDSSMGENDEELTMDQWSDGDHMSSFSSCSVDDDDVDDGKNMSSFSSCSVDDDDGKN